MRTEFILLAVIGVFFGALMFFLIVVYKPNLSLPLLLSQSASQKNNQAVSTDTDSINDLKSKVKSLEGNLSSLSQQQKDQISSFQNLKTYLSTQSAQTNIQTNNKSIIALANT